MPANVTADVAGAVPGMAAADTAAATPSETDWKAEAEKWKTFSRQNEERAKANAAAAQKLKEIEDRDLSELQRAQKQVEELSARAAAAERAQLRSSVALAKGLPAEVVGALVGDTAEELTAHADALLAWRGNAAPAPVPQPKPDASQGAQPLSPTAAEDADFAQYWAKLRPSNQ